VASGPIQTALSGLLDFLQLKNLGRNPTLLADSVQPVLNVNDWYKSEQPEVVGGRTGLGSTVVYAGYENTATLEVPSNEVWRVRDYTVALVIDLATCTGVEIYALAPAMRYRQEAFDVGAGVMVGRSRPFYDSTLTGPLPTNGNKFFAPSLRDFWAPPGAFLGFEFNGFVTDPTGGIFIDGYARIDRMRL